MCILVLPLAGVVAVNVLLVHTSLKIVFHHVPLLVEAHALNRQQVLRIEILQSSSLSEDVVDDLVLYLLFEVDHSSYEWVRRLILFVERLHLEERAEGVLLLALVELLVQAEFFLTCEDAVGKGERLSTVASGVSH